MDNVKFVLKDESEHLKIHVDHWSHSQDQTFRQCPLKWYRSSVLGLQKKVTSPALYRGLAVHDALEQFHSIVPKSRTKDVLDYYFEQYYREQRKKIEDREKLKDFDEWHQTVGQKVLQDIWNKYGNDPTIPKFSHTEYTSHVDIKDTGVPYEFRLDALVLNVPTPFIFETKTMSRDNRGDFDIHDLQAPRNIWAINKDLKIDPPIEFLVYNFIVFPTKTRGTILSRHKVQPTPQAINFAVQDLALVVNEAKRDDFVIYPKYGKSCQWSCDFYNLCMTQKQGNGDIDDMVENDYSIRETGTLNYEVL